eukprot:338596-Hanusia_phi.AAC.6
MAAHGRIVGAWLAGDCEAAEAHNDFTISQNMRQWPGQFIGFMPNSWCARFQGDMRRMARNLPEFQVVNVWRDDFLHV